MSQALAAEGKLMPDDELFNLKQAYSKMQAEYKDALKKEQAATAKREEEMSRSLEAKGKLMCKVFNLEKNLREKDNELKRAVAKEAAKREKREEEMSAALVAKGKLSSQLFILRQNSQKKEAELTKELEIKRAALAKREEEMSRTLQAKGRLMSEVFNLRNSSSKKASENMAAIKSARATIAKREEEMSRTLEAKGKLSSKLWHLQQAMRKKEAEYEDSLYNEQQKVANLKMELEETQPSHTVQTKDFEKEVDQLKTLLSEHQEKIKVLEAEHRVIASAHRDRIESLESEMVELEERHKAQLMRIERENEKLKRESVTNYPTARCTTHRRSLLPLYSKSPPPISFIKNCFRSDRMTGKIIEWLTQDIASPKHSTSWRHPIAAWMTHLLVSSLIIVTFHDAVVMRQFTPLATFSVCHEHPDLQTAKSKWVACFCFCYAILLLVVRLATNPPGIHRYSVLYGLTWLCNSALLFGGSFGLLTCRPNIATGFAVAVSIDQILWYVDVSGYAFNRLIGAKKKKMFPIGVCQYLVWEETHWSAKVTCTHHFWTIPLLIYGAGGIQWEAYYMNTITVASYVLLSRWLTPFGLNSKATKHQEHEKTPSFEKYMNVNLSHELWQDIRIGILRRQADNQTTMMYLFRLIIWWQIFNLFCFLLLRGLATTVHY